MRVAKVFMCIVLFSLICSNTLLAQIQTFHQQLQIQADPSAKVEILPVLDGKVWALTARWDDNNKNSLNMLNAMAEIGIKGTFYLNGSKGSTGEDFAKKLSTQGCSVGGHTHKHTWMTMQTPRAMFEDTLKNRIEREADCDVPVHSFAFPYGRYRDGYEPQKTELITKTLIRSGYHHNVYTSFVRKNKYMPENVTSTVNQIVPGDRKINADKFHAKMKKYLDSPEKYYANDYSISLGVHAWQPAQELVKFKELLSQYAGRDDFWYCNQNEFAAYRMQAVNSKLSKSQNGRYQLTRPTAITAGNEVPLTLAISGDKPAKVLLDGQSLPVAQHANGTWLVNLPYPATQALPQKIDWTHNAVDGKDLRVAKEFPNLKFKLSKTNDGNWNLVLNNISDKDLRDIKIILRLGLQYKTGLQDQTVSQIKAGQSKNIAFESGALETVATYTDGKEFAAAQVDFNLAGTLGRIYATFAGASNAKFKNVPRDAAFILGPIANDALDLDLASKVSIQNAVYDTTTTDFAKRWFAPSIGHAGYFKSKQIIAYNNDKAWKKYASKFTRKPGLILVGMDITTPESGPLTLKSELSPKHVFVDGKAVKLNKKITESISQGDHRIVMVLALKRHVFYKAQPAFMELTVNKKPVACHMIKK